MFVKSFVKAKLLLEEFKNDERGVTAIEYAVIGAAVAGVLSVFFVGTGDSAIAGQIRAAFNSILTALGGTAISA